MALIKPMLAYGGEWDIKKIKYPKAITPKFDGVRCMIQKGVALSRTLKHIPNTHIKRVLKGAPEYLDGEIIIANKSFHEVMSAVMSKDGEPEFAYMVFDYIPKGECEISYLGRIFHAAEYGEAISLVMPILVQSAEELEVAHTKFVEAGYEGTIVRDPEGEYKQGGSTLKEELMLKLVDYATDEAIIVGFEEELTDTLSLPKSTLGSLIVIHEQYGAFRIGTGFTAKERQNIWDHRIKYLNQPVTFKFKKDRTKDKPSQPVWLGIRKDLM